MTASEPTDLVLQVRLDSLGRCLAGVSQIKEGLARQQEGLESLKALLDKNAPLRVAARVISVDLPGWIAKLYDAHDIPEDPNLDPTKTQLTATAPTIMDDLRQAEKILNEIPTIQVPDEVLDLLAGPAGELAKTIETGVSQLEAAHRDQATDQDQSSDAVAAVWASVWDNQQRIRNVFSEYVDLLGGLALRSGGFGRNVFELADELIETLAVGSKVYWRSLTIPASAEKTEKTLAYMIRLGFPEWTIWALPLAAYGLGYVVIESRPDLHQNVGSIPGDPFGRDHVSSLLADVFATYTLGPAYVCANLLLRLNPFGAALVADRLRAAVLLATLEWMNSDHGEGTAGPFADVISKLRREWDVAVSQASRAAELIVSRAKASPVPGDAHVAPAELVEPENTGDAAGTVHENDLRAWVAKACGQVDKLQSARYKLERWEERQDWPSKLLADDGNWMPSRLTTLPSDILNAAWIARLQHPEATEIIEQAANRILEDIASSSERGDASRNRIIRRTK